MLALPPPPQYPGQHVVERQPTPAGASGSETSRGTQRMMNARAREQIAEAKTAHHRGKNSKSSGQKQL